MPIHWAGPPTPDISMPDGENPSRGYPWAPFMEASAESTPDWVVQRAGFRTTSEKKVSCKGAAAGGGITGATAGATAGAGADGVAGAGVTGSTPDPASNGGGVGAEEAAPEFVLAAGAVGGGLAG